jgi:hypothetical protein
MHFLLTSFLNICGGWRAGINPQCWGITCIDRIISISAGPAAMMQTATSTTTKTETTTTATRLLRIAYSSNDKTGNP